MFRATKIIATLGPVSDSEDGIAALIGAGVDVFRLNFSHGTHESHGAAIQRVRRAAERAGRCIAIMQDLSGPKIRTGLLRGHAPIELRAGDELRIVVGEFAGETSGTGVARVSTTYEALPSIVQPGGTLLLDDGHIQLRIEDVAVGEIRTTVIDGGSLGEHKGINAPGATFPSGALTAKDAADLAFGVSAGVDWIALSFVQSEADLVAARDALTKAGAPQLPLVAKLERPQALTCLDDILRVADAVMVARGDLGLEVPLERVPRIQKEITRRARAVGVPVIVATQVLESMRVEPRPTRAEVSDAANAVDDRVDAIMLAGETASGRFPVKAVQTLDAVIRDAEAIDARGTIVVEDTHLLSGHGRALCDAAVTLAEHAGAKAIVAITRGGKTARVLSTLRPHVPVFGATDAPAISRRLALAWGVMPVLTDLTGDVSEAASRLGHELVQRRAIETGVALVFVSINPDLEKGPSNFVKIHRVE
ncbi:MAG TPA: pyruvate kinase [Vicinamibacterales bacterium]|jgi:pyruvate kinase|nr:pyruvate kinase [Vicinamibacterales bacterium]